MKPALNEIPLPKYIAIEGPIGVGKTTLANKIAETFNYDAFLEQPAENPFLKNFYRNPSQSALATQLFFLFQRMQQIQDLKQRSLFENVRVADFLIEKDRLFAEVTLSNEEMNLYDKVYEHITLVLYARKPCHKDSFLHLIALPLQTTYLFLLKNLLHVHFQINSFV